MGTKMIEGMIPPVVVPFDEKEDIDRNAFRTEVNYLYSTGIDGISSGGSTGEGAVLSDEELRTCLEIVIEENKKNVPVVAGVIRNSTREVLKAALDAKAMGVDALLVIPIFYYSATLEGNYHFFKEIATKIRLPIIIYNVVPTNLITTLGLQKLAEIDEIIGIKQVDPVVLAEMVSILGDRMKVYGACDELLYGGYVSGVCGAISALVTVAPRLCVEQWRAFKTGDQAKAMEIHKKILPLVKCYSQKPFPGKVISNKRSARSHPCGRWISQGQMPSQGFGPHLLFPSFDRTPFRAGFRHCQRLWSGDVHRAPDYTACGARQLAARGGGKGCTVFEQAFGEHYGWPCCRHWRCTSALDSHLNPGKY